MSFHSHYLHIFTFFSFFWGFMKTAPANNSSSYLLKEIMSKNGRLSHPKWNMTSSKWKKSSPKLEDNLTQNGRHHPQNWRSAKWTFEGIRSGIFSLWTINMQWVLRHPARWCMQPYINSSGSSIELIEVFNPLVDAALLNFWLKSHWVKWGAQLAGRCSTPKLGEIPLNKVRCSAAGGRSTS